MNVNTTNIIYTHVDVPVKSRSRSLISFTTSKLKSKNITINLILYIYDTFAVIIWPCWCLFSIIVKKNKTKIKIQQIWKENGKKGQTRDQYAVHD